MDGFALLLGHFVGDYILQNDWMVTNKTNPSAPFLSSPARKLLHESSPIGGYRAYSQEVREELAAWERAVWLEIKGHVACTVHCLFYMLSIWAFSWWWIPWWGLFACFLIHWPMDRFRLARLWMIYVSGQKNFAAGPLAPWSVILVDNIFHMLTLYGIWMVCQK